MLLVTEMALICMFYEKFATVWATAIGFHEVRNYGMG